MKIGKYQIIRELGKGGFGVVFETKDTTLDREVALKVLHPHLAANSEFVSRFRKEAKALAKLEHPNIVTIYEFSKTDESYFIAMRYLPGGSLSQRISRPGGLPLQETLRITRQLIEALSYTHAHGVTHCDIKPNNILFDAFDNAMIADFGLARAAQTDVTATSTVISSGAGTPSYMPPEMWEEKTITPAVDQYSLACVIYEMLTGDRLFRGDSTPGIMNKHFKPVVLPDSIPAGLRAILLKALAKEPEERFADLHELQRALEEFASRPVSAPPDKAREEVKVFPSSTDKKAKLPKPRQTKAEAPKVPGRRPPAWLPVALVGVVAVAAVAIFASLGKLAIPAEQTPLSELLLTPTAAQTSLPSTEPKNTSTAAPSSTPEPTAAPSPTLIPTPALGVGSTRVRESDSMEQVYVPAGSFWMGSETGAEDERPVHEVYLDAYWIDKFEVTAAQFALCVAAGACDIPGAGSAYDPYTYAVKGREDFPIVSVEWYDAFDYCTWAGGRLPTEAEWEKAARGDQDKRVSPWGDDNNPNRMDYTWQLHPVGSYPAGASPYGALDMIGNASEWVQDRYTASYYETQTIWNNPEGPKTGSYRVIRDSKVAEGSYMWWYRGAASSLTTSLSNRDLSIPTGKGKIGFRCVSLPNASDTNPSASQPPETSPTATPAPALVPASTTAPTEAPIEAAANASLRAADGMEQVLIPAGSFTMGSDDGPRDERPVHQVNLDAFQIDKFEVSNVQYAQCVRVGACNPPSTSKSYTEINYFGNPDFDDYPVVYVTWNDAVSYCGWVGARLPTEAEWEKAARGETDARRYPWGNQSDRSRANFLGDETMPVGSYPNGASPYGVMDMAGNAAEWVADWYREDYYSDTDEYTNPAGAVNGWYKVVRGGSWISDAWKLRISYRSYDRAWYTHYYIGFRCATTP
ncbi:MAG: Serine/threonine-protein kinase PrkC [Chloroflexi bacterium ADurb.Bin360]|nr:MAG: Serine/threonine-protein kinase PrkC [Chloroflexi bacterium ADurb.Bin360]